MADEVKLDNENKDYSSIGDEVLVIDTPEALEAYQKKNGISTEKSGTAKGADGGEEENDEEELGGEGKKKETKKKTPLDINNPDFSLEDDGEEEEEVEYPNMVAFLNDRFDLKLNIGSLPKDMTKEQESEYVAEILDRYNQGVQARLAEYKEIDTILEDAEVKSFIEAKKAGKTMKDFVGTYAVSTEGAPDDVIVSKHLKAVYPTLSEQEIADQVKAYREKGTLEKMAAGSRKYFEVEDKKNTDAAEKARQKQEQDEERSYQESVVQFGTFVKNTNKVFNVAITPEMKKRVFSAVTKRDSQGLTEHDRLLRSDQGTYLSALGVLYMKQMLQTGQSKGKNQGKREIVNTLFETPDQLRSGSESRAPEEVNIAMANQF